MYTFRDASGNEASTSFFVNIIEQDTTPPTVLNCPSDTGDIVRVVELGTPSLAVFWQQPTAQDVSGTQFIQSQSHNSGDEFPAGTSTTVVIVFADDSGNVADPCTFTVTINTVDTTPPTVENCPEDIIRVIEVNSASQLVITWVPPTATDISGTAFISSQSASPNDLFPVGASTVVTYVFSDASGNDADPCTFNVIITTEDTTPPVITFCPQDITQTTPLNSGGVVVTWQVPTAVDNSNNDPIVTTTRSPGTFVPTGVNIVTYTFSDLSANSNTCSFTVTVIEVDTENPVITNCPTDFTVDTPLGTALTVVTWPALIVSDNSGQPSLLSQTAASGDSFAPGRNLVIIVYTDPSSNTATCQFVVTVREVDSTPPEVITCPDDISVMVPLESAGTTVTWNAPVVTDNSAANPTITSNLQPGSFFLRGTTTVTYTFTDGTGNQNSCSFTVTVTTDDNVPPTVTCPANIVVSVIDGVDGAHVEYDLPTVTDNSGVTTLVSNNANSGDYFPVGSNAVTYEYEDGSGNTGSCTFFISVVTDNPCASDPCQNGAACVATSLTAYQCICPQCFTGQNCETQLDACDGNLCQNGAACIAFPGSCEQYYCDCPACFVGQYCDTPVDACDNHQCANGGACVLDTDTCLTYTCSCPLCFTGDFCEIEENACDNHQCQNGAACQPVGDLCTEYTCTCPPCFTGDLCDESRDACSPSPCQNGGVCNTLADSCFSYNCDCVGCFTGYNCEIPIPSACENDPCQNGAACVLVAGTCSAYQCICTEGFSGVNCQDATAINTNPCNNFPCENGGSCLTQDSEDYTCLCREGFAGINCQNPTANTPGINSCSSDPCTNGGTCLNSYDSVNPTTYIPQYACICASGFTGSNCVLTTDTRNLLDICNSPTFPGCQNGGVCRNMYISFSGNMDYFCECPLGWIGHNCETQYPNPCFSAPCQNGGQCQAFNSYFTCDCQSGFLGTTCEIAVGDTQDPVIENCPTEDIIRTIASGNGLAVTWTEPTATDSGTVQRLLRSSAPGSFFSVGTTAVSYVFSDNSGNLASCTFFVTINLEDGDTTPPVIQNCPPGVAMIAPVGSISATASWTEPTAFDNGVELTGISNYNPGFEFPVGDTTVTYLFTDSSGNRERCTFTVSIILETVNQPPSITFCPAGPLLYLTVGSDEVVVNFPQPTATDDSNVPPSVTSNFVPGQSFAIGSYTITYTFTDQEGLQTQCIFDIQVVSGGDVTRPTISDCPTMAISAVAPLGVTRVAVDWTAPTATDASGAVASSSTAQPGSLFPIGITPVTYTFTDTSGNVAQCTFNVIVTGSSITPPPTNLQLTPTTNSITISWTPPTGSFDTYQLTVATSSGFTPIVETLPSSDTSFVAQGLQEGTLYVVTLYATSPTSGPSTSVSDTATTLTTGDTEPPQLVNCPQTFSIVAPNGASVAVVSWTVPTATDNSGIVTVTGTRSPDSQFPVGTTTVTYTAIDGDGNTDQCSFDVIITRANVTPPPSNLQLVPSTDSITISWTPPTSGFDGYQLSVSTPSGTTVVSQALPAGSTSFVAGGLQPSTPYVVNLFATGSNGASTPVSDTTTTLTPGDNTPPVLNNCPPVVNAVLPSGSSRVAVSWTAPTATDNSGVVTVTASVAPNSLFALGTTPVTYTATDGSGNVDQCTFDVIVTAEPVDDSIVIMNCPVSVQGTLTFGSFAFVSWDEPTATSPLGPVTVVSSPPFTAAYFPLGVSRFTYVYEDVNGNQATCEILIAVSDGSDTDPPTINGCPTAPITAVADPGAPSAVVQFTAPTATDVSVPITTRSNYSPGDSFNVGTTPVTYTFIDAAGYFSTCTFDVIVTSDSGPTDTTPPTFTSCPSSQTIFVAPAASSSAATWATPTATDDSGSVNLQSNFDSGALFPVGSTTVTYTALDASGNSDQCSFSITVIRDSTAPVLNNCPTSQTVTAAFGASSAAAFWSAPTATDNSQLSVLVTSDRSSGELFALGDTTVTYTATDAFNNAAQCSFVITVNAAGDTIPPEFTSCPDVATGTALSGSTAAFVSWTVPVATDNSGVVTVTGNRSPNSLFPVGTTTVTYTATDGSGNIDQCSFDVIVSAFNDVTPPELVNCPTDQTVTAAPGASTATVTWTPPTATDNSGQVTVTSNFPVGATFSLGPTEVEYTAVDGSNNIASCSFTVTVESGTVNQAPVVTFCPTNGAVYFTAPDATSVSVNYEPPTATDDSGILTASSSNQPGDVFPLGINTISYTFTDAEGLSAQCVFTINVQVGANPCSSNPCLANEQCFFIPTQYLCIVTSGRRRRDTEMLDLTDICPCMNGGTCMADEFTSSMSCQCPIGYSGFLCENEVIPDNKNNEVQVWSNGGSILLWSVVLCMVVMLIVIAFLTGLLCYVMPRLGAIHRRSKADEIPILQ